MRKPLITRDNNGRITAIAGGSLQGLANMVGYMNKIPRKPKDPSRKECVAGYNTRMDNWVKGLSLKVEEYEAQLVSEEV